jgi:hypothetical protein
MSHSDPLALTTRRRAKRPKAFASDHERFGGIDQRIIKFEGELDRHSWMIGAGVAMNIAILVRVMVPA